MAGCPRVSVSVTSAPGILFLVTALPLIEGVRAQLSLLIGVCEILPKNENVKHYLCYYRTRWKTSIYFFKRPMHTINPLINHWKLKTNFSSVSLYDMFENTFFCYASKQHRTFCTRTLIHWGVTPCSLAGRITWWYTLVSIQRNFYSFVVHWLKLLFIYRNKCHRIVFFFFLYSNISLLLIFPVLKVLFYTNRTSHTCSVRRVHLHVFNMVRGQRSSVARSYYITFLQPLLLRQPILTLIEFLRERKVLASSILCICGSAMATVKRTKAIDSYVWWVMNDLYYYVSLRSWFL